MATDNTIIQSLWIGNKLSTLEILSINSFISNGHIFHLYTYGKVENIPRGVIVKDANDIVSYSQVFTTTLGEKGLGSYATFSDYFRYKLLNKVGGWWVDLDMVCLKYFDISEDIVISSLFQKKNYVIAYNNVMKTPGSDELTGFLCKFIEEKIDFSSISYGDIGPTLLNYALGINSLKGKIVPYDYFNPYTYTDIASLVYKPSNILKILKEWTKDRIRPLVNSNSSKRQISSNTYAIHFFNLAWKENALDKNASYSRYCYFEQLKRRYL